MGVENSGVVVMKVLFWSNGSFKVFGGWVVPLPQNIAELY